MATRAKMRVQSKTHSHPDGDGIPMLAIQLEAISPQNTPELELGEAALYGDATPCGSLSMVCHAHAVEAFPVGAIVNVDLSLHEA